MRQNKLFNNLVRALLVLALSFAFLPAQSVRAAATIYVRSDGSDTCLGTTNRGYVASGGGATGTACAKQTIQAGLDAAVAGDTIKITYFPSIISIYSAFVVDKAVHIILAGDVRIAQNDNFPIFAIKANGVRISSEKNTEARLKPPAIENNNLITVASGVNSTIIDGLRFDGANQAGSVAILFEGAASNIQILNNQFSGFNGNDIKFTALPSGVVDIQGNYLGGSTTNGAISFPSANTLNVQYNSWSRLTGPMSYDTNALQGAVSAPFTYMETSVTASTQTPTVGDDVTFTVSAQTARVNGVEVYLQFDNRYLKYKSISTASTDFPANLVVDGLGLAGSVVSLSTTDGSSADINYSLDYDTYRYIRFHGLAGGSSTDYTTTSYVSKPLDTVTTENAKLFTVTFTVASGLPTGTSTVVQTAWLRDSYTMDAGYGPTNVVLGQSGATALSIIGNATVKGTVSMQGRVRRDGALVTLTKGANVPFSTSTDRITDNVSIAEVIQSSGWVMTTSKQGYLDLLPGNNKNLDFSYSTSFKALELKGGDANDDNVISVLDAGLIGADYGSVGRNEVAGVDSKTANVFTDINSSGLVDIYDLALMGGNYDLASLTGTVDSRTVTSAYNTGTGIYFWTPQ